MFPTRVFVRHLETEMIVLDVAQHRRMVVEDLRGGGLPVAVANDQVDLAACSARPPKVGLGRVEPDMAAATKWIVGSEFGAVCS